MSAQPSKYITAYTQHPVTRPPSSVVTTSLRIQEVLGFRFYHKLVVLAQPLQVYSQKLKTAITLQFSVVLTCLAKDVLPNPSLHCPTFSTFLTK
jgi:hypothetical protein